jgi:sulfate adenylyltransferase
MSLVPHGGQLVELFPSSNERESAAEASQSLVAITLSPRQLCDIELLLNGGFSPLTGFLGQKDYESVLKEMRLTSGVLWPIPITLDVSQKVADAIKLGQRIVLQDSAKRVIALMDVTDRWQPDKHQEAQMVFGTSDDGHPGVATLMHQTGAVYLGGPLIAVQLPHQTDFPDLRKTPQDLRNAFQAHNWQKVVAFQTRNPMHRAHIELTLLAAQQVDGHILIHPVVGMTKPGDINYITRLHCYQHVLKYYPENSTQLSLLPIAMRMAGPREALWHGIIRKNYGCTHFIVGRDHAGPGKDRHGKDFYSPYAAQELFAHYQQELVISLVPFKEMVYIQQTGIYKSVDEVSAADVVMSISGTEIRKRLQEGQEIPAWFSYPEVIEELREAYRLEGAAVNVV